MKYFCEQPFTYTDKNKLDTAVREFLKTFDLLIFDVDRIEIVKQTIIDVLLVLNTQHPRCTPNVPKWTEDTPFVKANDPKSKYQKAFTLWLGGYNSALKLKLCREEKDL